MEELDQIIKTASAVGAAVGGVASFAVTWGWRIWERQDSIMVRLGSARYDVEPGEALHIISRRAHRMEVTDYGFVTAKGTLISLPVLYEHDMPDPDNSHSGSSTFEKFNDRFEVKYQLGRSHPEVVGAYAITATQSFRTVNVWRGADLGWLRRQLVMFRARFFGEHE